MLPKHSICDVSQWSYGVGSECQLQIGFNQKRFYVTLSLDAPLSNTNTIEGSLLQKLEKAQIAEDDQDVDDVLEEIADVVCIAGFPYFEQLAPPNPQGGFPTDLYSSLHPETFYFRLVTVEDSAQLVRLERQSQEAQLLPLNTAASTLPTFAMRDIQVLQKLRGECIIKVLVDRQERCCKISFSETQPAVQREFDCLNQVMAANDTSLIRVPKLVGLVLASDNRFKGRVVDIIEELIHTPVAYSTLRKTDVKNVAKSQKSKWAEQVRQTVADLHRIDVVWGDGKADNVLVDANDDAWLIDFGGGWTPNWVDEKLAGTVEGDMQALQKIESFLELTPVERG